MRFIPIAGTGGYKDTWVREDSEFGRMMLAAGCQSIRTGDRSFRWSGALDGIEGDNAEWESFADSLFWFMRELPLEDRNVVAHSHAGQIVLILAARGFQFRSVTTVGTPCRDDIPLKLAEDNILFHQHIYDLKLDLMGWLGQFGEGFKDLRKARSFGDPRVLNIPVAGISHSKVLRDREHVGKWITLGWLQNMVRGGRA